MKGTTQTYKNSWMRDILRSPQESTAYSVTKFYCVINNRNHQKPHTTTQTIIVVWTAAFQTPKLTISLSSTFFFLFVFGAYILCQWFFIINLFWYVSHMTLRVGLSETSSCRINRHHTSTLKEKSRIIYWTSHALYHNVTEITEVLSMPEYKPQ